MGHVDVSKQRYKKHQFEKQGFGVGVVTQVSALNAMMMRLYLPNEADVLAGPVSRRGEIHASMEVIDAALHQHNLQKPAIHEVLSHRLHTA